MCLDGFKSFSDYYMANEYERQVMELFGIAEWDEALLNQGALDLYEELKGNADIQRCIAFMRANCAMAGYIDDVFAFYLLLSQDYFDAMKPCVVAVRDGWALSEEAFAEFEMNISRKHNGS